jgi:hypothetical protein
MVWNLKSNEKTKNGLAGGVLNFRMQTKLNSHNFHCQIHQSHLRILGNCERVREDTTIIKLLF